MDTTQKVSITKADKVQIKPINETKTSGAPRLQKIETKSNVNLNSSLTSNPKKQINKPAPLEKQKKSQ